MRSQPICGPLGPNFDGSCANNTTKMKIGTFSLWKVRHSRKSFYYAEPSKDQNVPLLFFLLLLAQEPSNLGPKETDLRLSFTNEMTKLMSCK